LGRLTSKVTNALLTLLFTLQPYSPVIEDRVCVIERNHLYDADGRLSFTQRIVWDADGMVQAWRMERRDWTRLGDGDYLFFDGGEIPVLRRIRAVSEIETWTQVFDREVENRNLLPLAERRELGARP
jgi:hypothetical protein